MDIDFSKYTRDELRQIIADAKEALTKYDVREKTKVFSLFVPLEGWKHYIDANNGILKLEELIKDGIWKDEDDKIKCHFLTDAELEYCQDYESEKTKKA